MMGNKIEIIIKSQLQSDTHNQFVIVTFVYHLHIHCQKDIWLIIHAKPAFTQVAWNSTLLIFLLEKIKY